MVIVNTKPIAVDDFLVFDEHAVISGNLLSNDYDPDGSAVYLRFFDNIRVDAKKGPTQETVIQGDYGLFKLHPNGTFSYELDHTLDAVKNLGAGQSLAEKITYKISDGGGATDVGQLVMKINGVDEAQAVTKALINGLSGEAGFGEIKFAYDDGLSWVDLSPVFKSGLLSNGAVLADMVIHDNGRTFMPNPTDLWGENLDLTPFFYSNFTGGTVWVDLDTLNDRVTITWDKMTTDNPAGETSFQLQLQDLGFGDYDLTYRYSDLAVDGASGISQGGGWAFYQDLDSNFETQPGNTGIEGVLQFHFEDGVLAI